VESCELILRQKRRPGDEMLAVVHEFQEVWDTFCAACDGLRSFYRERLWRKKLEHASKKPTMNTAPAVLWQTTRALTGIVCAANFMDISC
jgi:hypothetical protein